MSATSVAPSPIRTVRRVLDQLERALRPADTPLGDRTDGASTPADTHATDGDSTTTRELLVPTAAAGEPHAARASRQAQAYLERRRRKLSEQLDGR